MYVLVSLFGFLDFVFCFLGFVFCVSLTSSNFSLVYLLINSFFLFPFWCFRDFALAFHFVVLFFCLLSHFRFLLV